MYNNFPSSPHQAQNFAINLKIVQFLVLEKAKTRHDSLDREARGFREYVNIFVSIKIFDFFISLCGLCVLMQLGVFMAVRFCYYLFTDNYLLKGKRLFQEDSPFRGDILMLYIFKIHKYQFRYFNQAPT
jgi:hypothetical protein